MFGSGVYVEGHGTQATPFSWYVKWGMKPRDALRMATLNAADILNYGFGKNVDWWKKDALRT